MGGKLIFAGSEKDDVNTMHVIIEFLPLMRQKHLQAMKNLK